MEELGFEEESIGRILGRCPEIFAASVEKTFKKKLQQLVEFGISEDRLPQVIRKFPELLISDVNRTLLPRYSSNIYIFLYTFSEVRNHAPMSKPNTWWAWMRFRPST